MKIMLFAFCCFASLATVKAQTFSVHPSNIQNITVPCDSTFAADTVYISNPTSSDLAMSYDALTNTLPAAGVWTYQFCDWALCKGFLPTGTTDVGMVVPAGSSDRAFYVHMSSNYISASGSYVIKLYQTGVPSNSLTITWNASSCGSGISESANQTNFIMYPNPAGDFVNIEITTGYSKTGFIQVYNFVGDKLIELKGIKSNVQKIDLAKLPVGAYFVKYTNGEGTSAKKFFKTK